jgi:prophage regulatory protein
MTKRILRLPSVKSRTGLSRSTIYLRISQGIFPKPIALGGRTVGWIEEEIDHWLNEAVDQREKLETSTERGNKK